MKFVYLVILIFFAGPARSAETTTHTTAAVAGSLPKCVNDPKAVAAITDKMKANSKTNFKYDGYRAALSGESDDELVARLAYSETLAANCAGLETQIVPKIARVIKNRISLRNGNASSVVFQRDQFASSMNVYAESKYKEFLCPTNEKIWTAAFSGAKQPASGDADTVNYFLYRHSPKWTKEPWKLAEDTALGAGATHDCVRFFKSPGWK